MVRQLCGSLCEHMHGAAAEYMYGLRLCTDWQEDEEDGAAESELEDEMEDEVSLWHGLGAVSS